MRTAKRGMRYLTTGPIARKAEDLWPLLQILRGPDGLDPATQDWELGHPDEVDLTQVTIHPILDNGRTKVQADIQASIMKAVHAFESDGARVEQVHFQDLKDSFEIWSALLGTAGPKGQFRGDMRKSMGQTWGELFKWFVRSSEHTLPAIILALTEDLDSYFPQMTAKNEAKGDALKAEISEQLGENGVILMPVYPSVAPKHYKALANPLAAAYCAIFNVLEFPSTTVPMGLNAEGIPVGFQIVGNHGKDHLTIALAQKLEQKIWWLGATRKNQVCDLSHNCWRFLYIYIPKFSFLIETRPFWSYNDCLIFPRAVAV